MEKTALNGKAATCSHLLCGMTVRQGTHRLLPSHVRRAKYKLTPALHGSTNCPSACDKVDSAVAFER